MKRSFLNREENNLALANCLMLLSQGGHQYEHAEIDSNPSRVFECKTCNRQFNSFQALGGHRASHKKPRLVEVDSEMSENQASPAKPKTHERHRGVLSENQHEEPIVKKSNSRRVLCLDLNLTPLENDLELFKLGKGAPTINFLL
ncbi:hypothetical protein Gotri_000342 [Gossypium trilobum]|uniref:C2H2-type domain-containing protein n=1 Tax=Gossypium trilobum TaxID=34281 RepID=A0A7J9FB01_9ROSI|nr:hypothetical protein [Gossypium trilobum]